MPDFDTLQAEAERLISQEPPALPDIRKFMLEMDEFFNSPDFQALGRENRTALQGQYKELRARVRGPEAAPAAIGALGGAVPAFSIPENGPTLNNPPKARVHDPQAEQAMTEAE